MPAYQWPLKNSIRIERNDFNLTFQHFEQGTLMQLYFSHQANIPKLIDQQLPELFIGLSIPESEYSSNLFDELAEQVSTRKLHHDLTIADPHLGQIRNTNTQLMRMASELMGITEGAYQMMEEERNPELIWDHVENEFLANELQTIFDAQNKKG